MINIGDHIYVYCNGYSHHGIYIGENQVIHYQGKKNKNYGQIIQTSLQDFSRNGQVFRQYYSLNVAVYAPSEVVERAKKRLGEVFYNLVFNNCEHFATWCITGNSESEQVDFVENEIVDPVVAGTAGVLLLESMGISIIGATLGTVGSVIVAPVATVGVTGYGLYKFWKGLKRNS